MAYFDKIPNISYLKYKKNPYDGDFITIKNIFGRVKVIDDVLAGATVFEDILLKMGKDQTPFLLIIMEILDLIGLLCLLTTSEIFMMIGQRVHKH